jgi:hypothetical protein
VTWTSGWPAPERSKKTYAFPYPKGAGKDDDDAVNGFKHFDEAIKMIEDSGADNKAISLILLKRMSRKKFSPLPSRETRVW